MATPTQLIRIFISSPSDVSKERKAVENVIEELNRTICEPNGIMLCPLTWEKNTYPSVGEYPQDVINKQIGEYDIFVGIMASRFGTPTLKAGSGTEEEFNIAYENRSHTQIMFFFKSESVDIDSLDNIKVEQINKVKAFKKKVFNQGVFYKQFSKNFEKEFRECLTKYLSKKYFQKNIKGLDDDFDSVGQLKTKVEEYLYSNNPIYEKYSNIGIWALGNPIRKLKDIYVIQSLVKRTSFIDDMEIIRIDRFPKALMKKYKRILITNTAGMGKSTIMKFMYIDLIDNRVKDAICPIYIELNRLNKEWKLLDELQKQLNILPKINDKKLLLSIINTGGFVFFMDGYDEIPVVDKNEVTSNLLQFITDSGENNYFILTSRPEDGLSVFGSFQQFQIRPLTREESYELINKCDISERKETANRLIKKLKAKEYEAIDDYLENPLLVSLLYATFDFSPDIPLKKHQYYKQVYDAFFARIDLAKGIEPHKKNSCLDKNDFFRVLRFVGYACLEKFGVRFDKDTILKVINDAKDYYGNLSFKESSFLKDLIQTVPLVCKEGIEYKWIHKSFMDYLAAQFIAEDAKENKDKILARIFSSHYFEKYINMLDIYYDIDPKGFTKNLVLPLCEKYIEFYDNNITCSSVTKELIEERISFMFKGRYAFMFSKYGRISGEKVARRFYLDELRIISPGEKAIYVGYSINQTVLKFFSKKMPMLFTQQRNSTNYSKNLWSVYNGFEPNEVYKVDVKTGYESEVLYSAINYLIAIREFNLNYEACKKEAERIRNEIVQSNNPSGRLDGI